MRPGLYKVEFQTPIAAGAGVIVLDRGRLWGGDSRIYYIGTYAEDGNQITADVRTDAHSLVPNMGSVFGVDRVNISLRGTSKGDSAQMTGKAHEAPELTFEARLERISE